ncbi:recombinase family protein [Streptomyces sp. CB01373]|uniref:recombinase family protein n=1 Tax=Streptomyces sp. CB01373 TaxID=2020325 RepID=UPI001F478878|nr:recombinase family protein [Streptomyces sp. CB01373]
MDYARSSTAQQELQSRLGALQEAGCGPVFSEKISTRVKARPEFGRAMDFARTMKKAPHQRDQPLAPCGSSPAPECSPRIGSLPRPGGCAAWP